jgi:hypothetical protein
LWLTGDLLHTTAQITHSNGRSNHDEDADLGARNRAQIVEAASMKSWALGVSHFGQPFGRVGGGSREPSWEPV